MDHHKDSPGRNNNMMKYTFSPHMLRFRSENLMSASLSEISQDTQEDENESNRQVCKQPTAKDSNVNKDNAYHDDPSISLMLERTKSSLMLLRRQSSFTRKKIQWENTYRMEPKPNLYFIWWKVRNAIQKLMTPVFENYKYDGKVAPTLCKLIASKCLALVKRRFEFPRYRYLCHVTLAQLNNQGIMIGDRCVWNTAFDNYAPCVFKTKTAVCVITFYGIYLE
ncbi:dynein light chain Tctex-type 5-like [Physella acuta]|uniref:dynein light chain Tctex-type 5-like n=1 Tax=Physella acuta TaxID=109671 RepID=UPI0027DE4BB2|nr:dynein light chain Tctex-type 5-like [Physella acuta]